MRPENVLELRRRSVIAVTGALFDSRRVLSAI
jgi:hypothetical protein